MTDQTNADIARHLREYAQQLRGSTHVRHTGADLIEQAAAALEAAEQRAEEAERRLNNMRHMAFVYGQSWADDREKSAGLAAVVEKVRAARANHPACEKHPDGAPISCGWKGAVLDIDAALATAPDDALREVKAAAWDEGHDAGWEDRHQDALAGWMPSDPYESEAVNPYRKEQS